MGLTHDGEERPRQKKVKKHEQEGSLLQEKEETLKSKPKKKKRKDNKKRKSKAQQHPNNESSTAKPDERKKKKKKDKIKKRKKESLLKSHDGQSGRSLKKLKASRSEQSSNLVTSTNNIVETIGCTPIPQQQPQRRLLAFEHKYILAPMVGASELAFRLLCRRYGTQLAYTPMMSSTQFASDETYRNAEFQTIPEDRPLVCHFSANNPQEFAAAAKLCEKQCDAIDLNLGCPQRTAYVGHFGSYLLDKEDRELICNIIRAGVEAVNIPIFCKIRLLDTLPETIELCQQLRDAGASLIAIHARYRASFERKGPGARDGPAMLDQVMEIKKAIPEIPIIANGNVITYEDVVNNLNDTNADGIMSAEGILDNPALFLPRIGPNDDSAHQQVVKVADPSPLVTAGGREMEDEELVMKKKKKRKLLKKMREIEKIEKKIMVDGASSIDDDQRQKLASKFSLRKRLDELVATTKNDNELNNTLRSGPSSTTTSLANLYKSAQDKVQLAEEYLSLACRYPIKIRSVIFHTRRMLKDMLNQYQLMEECIACQTVDEVQAIVHKCRKYRADPESFTYDRDKAVRQKEALDKKRREEGKRKAYEARMIRKAKREGREDLEFYLRIGAEVPTVDVINKLRSLPREQQLNLWKKDHSQHCMAYHLDPMGCKRDRACAFLHVDAKGVTTFVESDEVAG